MERAYLKREVFWVLKNLMPDSQKISRISTKTLFSSGLEV